MVFRCATFVSIESELMTSRLAFDVAYGGVCARPEMACRVIG